VGRRIYSTLVTRGPRGIGAAVPLALMLVAAAGGGQQPLPPAASVPVQHGILVLHVDDVTRPWTREITESFVSVFQAAPEPPAVYFETLDAARFWGGGGYLEALRGWLRRKYSGKRIDLVLTVGEDALAFLAQAGGEPWPDAQVLYAESAGVGVDTARTLPRAGGVILEDPFPPALATLKAVLPGTQRLVLVYGASSVDRGRMGGFADKVRAAGLGLEPIVWAGLSREEMLAAAARLPPNTAVFLLEPTVDATGHVFSPGHLCRLLASASVPLFARQADDLGCGIVGGVLLDLPRASQFVAHDALARLARPSTEVRRIPAAEATQLAFDARQLARFGIPESRLPEGSDVLYRTPNVWRDYRGLVLIAMVVTLTQALLITDLVLQRRRRSRAELAERRHLAAMAHLDRRSALGELAASLAHELNQPLNSILQNAGAAQMMLASPDGPPTNGELVEILEDIQKEDARAGEVIRRMRALLQKGELDAKPTDPYALIGETVHLVRPEASARGVCIDADLAEGLTPIQADRVHLQQVLLNLLMNAADAVAELSPDRRLVRVLARPHGTDLEVSVTDQGPGIAIDPPERIFEAFYTTKGKGLGMGLSICRTIVDAHHGRMGARNEAGGGATVWFRVPQARDR